MKKKAVKKTVKRKSKGKQHVVHATSLLNLATAIDQMTYLGQASLARIFRAEAKRVQGILR